MDGFLFEKRMILRMFSRGVVERRLRALELTERERWRSHDCERAKHKRVKISSGREVFKMAKAMHIVPWKWVIMSGSVNDIRDLKAREDRHDLVNDLVIEISTHCTVVIQIKFYGPAAIQYSMTTTA